MTRLQHVNLWTGRTEMFPVELNFSNTTFKSKYLKIPFPHFIIESIPK